jgi:hypothetical protein
MDVTKTYRDAVRELAAIDEEYQTLTQRRDALLRVVEALEAYDPSVLPVAAAPSAAVNGSPRQKRSRRASPLKTAVLEALSAVNGYVSAEELMEQMPPNDDLRESTDPLNTVRKVLARAAQDSEVLRRQRNGRLAEWASLTEANRSTDASSSVDSTEDEADVTTTGVGGETHAQLHPDHGDDLDGRNRDGGGGETSVTEA